MYGQFGKVVLAGLVVLGSLQSAFSIEYPPEAGNEAYFMPVAGRVMAPMGFIRFCAITPDACRPTRGKDISQVSAGATLAILAGVNRSINNAIRPKADGRIDDWRSSGPTGDCEDFALAKQAALLRAGWPSKNLLLTTAKTADGQNHAVLVVRTASGDYILDNLTSNVRRWDEVGYAWLKQQSPSDPKRWVAVAA